MASGHLQDVQCVHGAVSRIVTQQRREALARFLLGFWQLRVLGLGTAPSESLCASGVRKGPSLFLWHADTPVPSAVVQETVDTVWTGLSHSTDLCTSARGELRVLFQSPLVLYGVDGPRFFSSLSAWPCLQCKEVREV